MRTARSKIEARLRSAGRGRRLDEQAVERSLVWMLGSPRTGSTWLLNLLRIAPEVVLVDEPAIGSHLGLMAADVMGAHPAGFDRAEMMLTAVRANDDQYFFSQAHAASWQPHLRRMLLARFRDAIDARKGPGSDEAVVVIKEPAGSQAAEMLLSVLPASRLLFLLRDGRDVIDSEIAAVQKGGWLAEMFASDEELEAQERIRLVRALSHRWVVRTQAVSRAYERHDSSRRLIVRYEELLTDTSGSVARILDWLDLSVERDRLTGHVQTLSFDALPQDRKGTSRFARAATPGLWRENLTSEERSVMDDVMGDTLLALGYARDG